MSKTYTLQGPIFLDNLSNTDALAFVATVVDVIPSYSMGTANLNIRAQGPAGTADGSTEGNTQISGGSSEELKASLAEAQEAPKAPEDIIYDVRGRVHLVGLSFTDGMEIVDAVMNAIPPDSLVMANMLVLSE